MISFLLKFRFKQGFRLLDEIGFMRLLVLSPFLFIIVLVLLERFIHATPWQIVVVFSFFLASSHFSRKDKAFLQHTYEQPKLVYWAEYFVLYLPILIWLGSQLAWLPLLSLLAIILVLPFFNWTLTFNQTYSIIQFPKQMHQDFEWMIGIRNQGIWLILIYGIALMTCFYIVSVLAALLLFAIIIATFYLEDGEERVFLHLYADNPSALMQRKVKRSIGLFLFFTSPLSFVFLIFHFQYWYLLLAVLVISSIIQLSSVTLRYATYGPKATLKQNSWILGLLLACWLAPFFQPVPLLMTITYYKKALNRLKNFY